MSNNNFADSLMESFSVSACCFVKKYECFLSENKKSPVVVFSLEKIVEKLILQRNSNYNSLGKFPPTIQLLVLEIES